jgi:hypothetical protein
VQAVGGELGKTHLAHHLRHKIGRYDNPQRKVVLTD